MTLTTAYANSVGKAKEIFSNRVEFDFANLRFKSVAAGTGLSYCGRILNTINTKRLNRGRHIATVLRH